jgi:uncharacterized membrane protein
MIDWILRASELPNIHPALVHFPMALLPVAIGFDLVGWVRALRGRPGGDGATVALYVLAALGAWASVWAGEEAEESLSGLPRSVHDLIHEHEEWAERFLYTIAVVALARVAVAWWGRRGRPVSRGVLLGARAAVLVGALVALRLLAGTADRGGGLVFRAGVAVMAVPAEEASPTAPEGEEDHEH